MGSWLSLPILVEMRIFGWMEVLCFIFFIFLSVDFLVPSTNKCFTSTVFRDSSISFRSTLILCLNSALVPVVFHQLNYHLGFSQLFL